jgi:hypothetical protein
MHARRALTRSTGIFLLAVVAWASLAFPSSAARIRVQSGPAPIAHLASTSSYLPLDTLKSRTSRSVSQPAETLSASVAQRKSVGRQVKGRTFVEDTTSPSRDSLKTTRRERDPESSRTVCQPSPVSQNRSVSLANRQRAP